jgi:hypothetical protein
MLKESPLIQLECALQEAREVAAYHRRLQQYWHERVYKLERQLPGLVEAEATARRAWEGGD